ncbi:MerR family transcriptional regulator [Jannaschia sp. KMU-145]|uniref:MerR family transcriptional regulator n=1 Tax=Jannaschia halovivens TaxID=3388667 RepID=UPI00396B2C19
MAKPPEKADGAFRTIREVADWLTVPTHVLRFWESKFEQIAPVKGAGGRRYYRPEDMRLLGGIKVLLHDRGLTIRGVGQKIDDDGVEPVMALSPELEMPEQPVQRTRKVIRNGEAESTAPRVVPFDRKTKSPAAPDTPVDATQADRPEADPVEAPGTDTARPQPADRITLPAGPDQPAPPTPEDTAAPGDALDPASPDEDAEPIAPDGVGPVPDGPSPDMPEVDLPDVAEAAPQPDRPEPDAAPPAMEIPMIDAAAPPPTLAALRLARAATGIDASNARRMRRVIRKLRGLVEEIEDELDA